MKYPLIRKGLVGVMGLFIATSSLATVAAIAAPSGAATSNMKICKTLNTVTGLTLGTSPVFKYNVTGVDGEISVTAGSCSMFIAPVGTDTVTEVSAPWYSVQSITPLAGSTYVVPGSTNLAAGSVKVTVTNSTSVDELTYTNNPVTGYVEVCKDAATGSGLTGTYAFTVTGPDGFSTPASAVINNCSGPILVPAGPVTVTEGGTNLYVTAITANTNGVSTKSDLVGTPNLVTGTVTANVAASSDSSTQTDVTYTNNVVAFEVCKTWDSTTTEPGGSTTSFPFTFTATGPAGPNTAPSALVPGLQAGQCSPPTYFRPGTAVSVTEGIVPGTKVESIATDGNAESVVPGSLSITGRTVTVIVGTPTTSSLIAPTNDAVVTFQNEAADPGTLKICKTAGTIAPVGSGVFTYTVSGDPGVTTSVNLGDCALVLNSSGSTMLFPFNSTQTIIENGTAGNAAVAITTVPALVAEKVAGKSTLTSELVQPTGSVILGTTGTTSQTNVVIGEDTLTEAQFTDTDPPATVSPASANIPGDLGTTTGANQSIATAVANSPSVIAAAQAVTALNRVAVAATAKLSPSERKALLRHDKAALKSVDAKIASELVRVAHTKGTAHKVALKRLAALRAEQRSLKHAISKL